MPRRRMIDPNFWSSPDVAKLTHFERLVLIGLFSHADDEGKGFANQNYISNTLFPYETIRRSQIGKSILHIEQHISIKFYEVNNGKYYKFLHWDKWQRVDKPQHSKIPDPPSDKNDSKNDSKNHSDNQNGLKEVKGKEVKGSKEENGKNFSSLSEIQTQNPTPKFEPGPAYCQNCKKPMADEFDKWFCADCDVRKPKKQIHVKETPKM